MYANILNIILFFLIITAIHIYYEQNVSHNIADFSAPMGHKIFRLYINSNDPLYVAVSQPHNAGPDIKRDHHQKAENTECQPTLQHAIRTFIQMFAFPKLCGSLWKQYRTSSPRRQPPIIQPITQQEAKPQ